jgi:molecular chaperone GrpE
VTVVHELPANQNEEPKAKVEKTPSIQQIRKELDEAVRQKDESERKSADYFERLQRLQADMENLQKVTKRQLDAVTKQASERLLVSLLPILDAMQQAEMIAHSGNSLPPDEIAVGLQMLRKQLVEILSSEGLEEIPTVGRLLDPELHEVVSYIETDNEPENTIVEEVRNGYLLNGKVIRPSLVVVSKMRAPEDKPVEGSAEN